MTIVNLSLQIDRHNDDSGAEESATILLQAGHSYEEFVLLAGNSVYKINSDNDV